MVTEQNQGKKRLTSGVDYMRLWSLPVVQPWQSTPDPVEGVDSGEIGREAWTVSTSHQPIITAGRA
jgi:hypothetical protein